MAKAKEKKRTNKLDLAITIVMMVSLLILGVIIGISYERLAPAPIYEVGEVNLGR